MQRRPPISFALTDRRYDPLSLYCHPCNVSYLFPRTASNVSITDSLLPWFVHLLGYLGDNNRLSRDASLMQCLKEHAHKGMALYVREAVGACDALIELL